MGSNNSKYSEEMKEQTAKLVIEGGKSATRVAEELGLIGASLLLVLFLILIFRMIKIGKCVSNEFHKYLSFGIGLFFFVQVFINIGVVIGLLPVTGVTLPIISYGGTSLMISLMMIGIVLNISKYKGD
jgi:cell division protein FtsW